MNRRFVPGRAARTVLALSVAALVAAAATHPAAAAPKAAATASPSPAPSPTATPEPLDKAIPRLESQLKTDPNNKQAQTELAGDYLQVNRPDLALPLTQKLLAGGTKTAQVYYFDSLGQIALGRAKEGTADLENAANLEPTNAGVLGTLTNLYLQEKRPQDAERVAKRALTFNKDDKNAYIAYGSVLASEGKYDEARQQFEGAVKLDPKDVRPILLESQTYLNQNSVALAASLYDRALTIDPSSVEALIGKARLAAAQHNVKDAIATYERICTLQTDPADKAAVIDQEAAVYANEKMDADADATYKRAIAQYPTVFSAHTAYGDYLVVAQGQRRRRARVHRRPGPQPRPDRRGRAAGPALRQPEQPAQGDRPVQAPDRDRAERPARPPACSPRRTTPPSSTTRRAPSSRPPTACSTTPDALIGLGQTDIADPQLRRVRASLRRARPAARPTSRARTPRSSTAWASATRSPTSRPRPRPRTRSCSRT